ncbi:hypothetical protein ACQ86N_25370 [Puia sp. P3]|uniref:hypothetical protein n=1 Tax=Puia sp. P3 TaxID=3423952 RepID=UPI003D668999
MMHLISTDLPTPDFPRMTTFSSLATVRLKSLSTILSPNRLETCSILMTGSEEGAGFPVPAGVV